MIKREFKVNLKPFIIWSLIMIATFLLVALVYPSLSAEQETLDEMMKLFPKEMLEMFNMDVIGIGSFLGWILSEGFMMITLLGSAYASILGSNIILKEEEDKTIEFLASKPVKRNKIITSKLITGISYILLLNIVTSLTILIGLLFNNEFEFMKWFLIFIGPIFIYLLFFVIAFIISLYSKKSSKCISINLGIVFLTYIFSILSSLTEKIEFLKYLSPFYYINSRTIILDNKLEIMNISLLSIVTIITIIFIYKIYNKKELSI